MDVLCKQTRNIEIEERDIYGALDNDNVQILKFLLCGMYMKVQIACWNDIERLQSSSMISLQQIKSMISYCENNGKRKEFLKKVFVCSVSGCVFLVFLFV